MKIKFVLGGTEKHPDNKYTDKQQIFVSIVAGTLPPSQG